MRSRSRLARRHRARANFAAYRFSVAWPRVLPFGSGTVAPRGLECCDRLVGGLLANGIAPWLCLCHWDLPQALQEQGGWLNRDIGKTFATMRGSLRAGWATRVKHWAVFTRALAAGVKLRGDFVWSLLDNFQWAERLARRLASSTSILPA